MERTFIIPSKAISPPLPISSNSKSKVFFTKRNHPTKSTAVDARLNELSVNGNLEEAVNVLDSIAQQGSTKVRPITYINLIRSCIDRGCSLMGRQLHARIGLVEKVDAFVEAKLLSMYAKFEDLDEARKLFDGMREKNLYAWSAMISACSRQQNWEEVVDLFYDMMEVGIFPDEFLVPKILQACGKCRDLETVKLIHSLVIRRGMSFSYRVNNSILGVYAKCGEMDCAKRFFRSMDVRTGMAWDAIITGYCQKGQIEQARKFFDAMHEEGIEPGLVTWNVLIATYNQLGNCDIAVDLMRKMENLGISPDVYTWTSMISGFAQNSRINQSLDLLKQMFIAGIEPTGVTIASAASACESVKSLKMGREIHSVAVKTGLVDDVLVGNSIIDLYAKCGDLEAARQIFDMMLERDVYSWNSIIGGYCQAGYCGKAYELFIKMQEYDVRPNIITWNIMVTGYMQNDDEDQALDLFQRIEKDGKIKPNAASWNSLISSYLQSGRKDKALQMFRQMQCFCIIPNTVTMLSVLPACANLVAGRKVKEIHCCALRRDLVSERSVLNLLIDTYAKSGNIMYSRTVFDGMSFKDIITWNSMIAGYVLHGCSKPAIHLFDLLRKDGLQPTRGTLASIILAYGLAGMVDEGKRAFFSITEDYLIRPCLEHYAAMVYLLGRSGRLAEALEFIKEMPIEPNSSVWAALLTACRIHKNFGLAILAGEHLLDLEPGNIIIHKLLSQAYSLCGTSWESPNMARHEKEKAMKKLVGRCWIESKSTVQTFLSGDRSKEYSDKLYSWIESLPVNVKVPISGKEPCIEEEEEEGTGSVHSEKLAFAFSFSFINSHCTPQTIRMVKNLRMCKDCHETAKYISVAYGCEIYVNDSTCFHHFRKGHCSCGDYW